jgi:hypothetical protein
MWLKPLSSDENQNKTFATILRKDDDTLLARLTKSKCGMVRFPLSTAYLHGLGAVSAALNKAFKIKYYDGTIPLNLYVITAQRPSTGKSGINSMFINPITKAYKNSSDKNAPQRAKLESQLIAAEKKYEAAKNQDEAKFDDFQLTEAFDKIEYYKAELIKVPRWRCNLTDPTIEAAEGVAASQGGMFNIVTAEADAINVVTGGVYSAGGGKKNLGLILSAWDGEHVSSARVTRDGIDCEVRASISVLAQPDAIDTILEAGSSGRGITERFLLLAEPSLLGYRGQKIIDMPVYNKLKQDYENLIQNIVDEDNITIDFTKAAELVLDVYIESIEPHLADNGKYSNDMICGFMGKADKHIRKIAGVLHCCEEWQSGGKRSVIVNAEIMIKAKELFKELADRFVFAADSLGHSGLNSECEKLIQYFTERAEKGKLKLDINTLRRNIAKTKPFTGSSNLTSKLRNEILPILEISNHIIVASNIIYINPRLA